ncbi:hypothetical protein [Jannaschia pohangensis]|uniref:DUF3299 domain-containing protein n=1 Tax=Jannaschia pohangensis TaxID=390807 RepID=A0A1I3NBI5_9RHOB|nr:hypothetical protein [Jannaschia pohangensis]SFJ06515.1 hypothetical protein SAMN04488095_2105 [Jannaschia pohangensis]
MQSKAIALLPFAVLAGGANADEAAWDVIRSIDVQEKMTETSYRAIKTFPAAIENGVEQFDITGFVIPMDGFEPGAKVTTLMLVSDMVTCPFCGLPDHAAALEVALATPLDLTEGERITLRGALELNHDPETAQAATLTAAKRVPG